MLNHLFTAAALLIGLVFAPQSAQAWSLAWDQSTGVVEGYVAEISTDGGATYPYVYVITDGTRLNLDDKCEFNTTYTFRVSAFNPAGISAPCPSISWYRPPYEPPTEVPLPIVNNGPGTTPQGTQVVPN